MQYIKFCDAAKPEMEIKLYILMSILGKKTD